ncbi:hypothetical protein UY3_02322 [Chelonia mydas]|uniref:Uncharacterized protein n=1 Tax=Chelonia mydas TaxID=8469 RepID=M7CHM9_CHEMY|nr:hypothetical protein UY3_02322 [Chelonia mydas]
MNCDHIDHCCNQGPIVVPNLYKGGQQHKHFPISSDCKATITTQTAKYGHGLCKQIELIDVYRTEYSDKEQPNEHGLIPGRILALQPAVKKSETPKTPIAAEENQAVLKPLQPKAAGNLRK